MEGPSHGCNQEGGPHTAKTRQGDQLPLVENAFYQRPLVAVLYATENRPARRGGLMLGRGISAVVSRLLGRRTIDGAPSRRGRDILWRAKRNTFRRALADHGVREEETARILRLLAGSDTGACELALLGSLAGATPSTLDNTLSLMGLHNLVTIEERYGAKRCRPKVYVVVTEHGLRYAREVAPFDEARGAEVPGAESSAGREARA